MEMPTEVAVRDTDRLVERFLHVFALSGLSLAQPMLDLLGATPGFFVARRLTWLDGALLGLLLVVLVPAVAILVLALLRGRWRRRAAAAMGGLLVMVLVMQLLQNVMSRGSLVIGLAALAGIAFAYAYQSVPAVHTALRYLAIAPVIFLAIYLFRIPSAGAVEVDLADPGIEREVPVVVLLFDEMALAPLLDADLEFDATLMPNFRRLTSTATWYRYATAAHDNTLRAVPSLLTGRNPDPDALATAADHPQNLFTLLAPSHTMEVIEPVTQLCPVAVCGSDARRTPAFRDRFASLAEDLPYVYLHIVLPEDQRDRLPAIGTAWEDFGGEAVASDAAEGAAAGAGVLERFLQSGEERADQFGSFLAGLATANEPALHFIHLDIPHPTWRYLPSGRRYPAPHRLYGLNDAVGRWRTHKALANQGLQRYLLQAGLADALLGEVIDELESAGIFDQALLVVTADQGVAFTSGGSRRAFTDASYPWVGGVPLLIKLPGQAVGEVDNRNATVLDVTPTIMDFLGGALPEPVDGISLLAPPPERPPDKVFRTTGRDPIVVPFADYQRALREAVQWREAIIPAPLDPERILGYGPFADLHGVALSTIAAEETADLYLETVEFDPDDPVVPVHIIVGVEEAVTADGIAVAIEDTIWGSATPYEQADGFSWFSVFLPEEALSPGTNAVTIVVIEVNDGSVEPTRINRY